LISIFIIFIYFNSIANTILKANQTPKQKLFEANLYLQKLYPGLSPLGNLQFSQNKLTLKHFTLNGKMLFFTHPEDESTQIKGAIKVKFLLDKRIDQPTKGKCCSNIVFKDYSKTSKNPKKSTNISKKHEK